MHGLYKIALHTSGSRKNGVKKSDRLFVFVQTVKSVLAGSFSARQGSF